MTAGSVAAPLIIPIRVPLPGKAKHEIDTATLLEIKSDTPDVVIYFTLDGTKPEVERRLGSGDSNTLRYTAPVCLPAGRVTVRAFAVRSDGRESAVVTKVFLVDPVLPRDDADDPGSDHSPDHPGSDHKDEANMAHGVTAATENGFGDTMTTAVTRPPSSCSIRTPIGPRFLTQRLGNPTYTSDPPPHTEGIAVPESPLKNLSLTHMSRIQRETDFLRCASCLSARPSDPFARFCLSCGATVPPVPGHRLPPTEGAQMGVCVSCKSLVPVNTWSCVVCEAPIAPQLQPQASLRLQDKVICPSCGTGNPAHISSCVTCEARLPQAPPPVCKGLSAPPLPSCDGRMISCSKCHRVNHADARYCDWCGAKPGHVSRLLTCSMCGCSSPLYATYCSRCGVYMEGPHRQCAFTKMATSRDDHSVVWQPAPSPSSSSDPALRLRAMEAGSAGSGPMAGGRLMSGAGGGPTTTGQWECADAQTQTVGLFYPSAAQLERRGHRHQQGAPQLTQQQLIQEGMRERRPLLTSISPGRGYWRKQLDHVCFHLRSYTQGNQQFQSLIGEPRMGRAVSAVIEKDDLEVSLRINFVAATPDSSKAQEAEPKKPMALSDLVNLSSVTEGAGDNPRVSLSSSSPPVAGPRKSFRSQRRPEKQPPISDTLLLKEVGPEGKGRVQQVQQLLEEGADPSCQDSQGNPVLVVAVTNGHHEVIPVLVQRGADVNSQSGPFLNTALHVAAALGAKGLQSTETLLGCKASLRKRNGRGQTPYDVAIGSDCRELISIMAAHTGQEVLHRLSQSHSS
ncbi:double zinc ribbon and ankyrin repeat-containing protein 1 [Engraulis encrasicolus]|uniref:double zinc ribbon and ankyrin repeat-containing protein 1 n=1 Tax=Engraulis encrasicolus TaxID=184585 RepID=UPI002FD0E4A0